jgi:hypothetical protein
MFSFQLEGGGGGRGLTSNSPEAEFMNVQIVADSGHYLASSQTGFPYTMFTLQTSFKPLLLGGGWESRIR